MKAAIGRKGFTLTEAVIAVMVVGIGLAGVMSMVLWMVRANGWGGNMTTAAVLGQGKLEELVGAAYVDVADSEDTVEYFTRTWTVSNEGDEYKTIELEIEWERPNGEVSQVTIQSLRSNPVVPGVDLSPFDIGDTLGAGGGGGGGGEVDPPLDGEDPPLDGGGDPVLQDVMSL